MCHCDEQSSRFSRVAYFKFCGAAIIIKTPNTFLWIFSFSCPLFMKGNVYTSCEAMRAEDLRVCYFHFVIKLLFRHGTIYHRRHYMKRKFLDWLKLKICGSDLHKFFLSEKPLSCEQWKPFPSNNRWEHKMSWSLTYCPAKIRTKVWYASFSLWLLILRSYQIASQTSIFSTIVILSESKTYRPMQKNSNSQNSVTPHCICINVYRFWLQEKFFFGTSFNSLTVWIVAKF